MIDLNKYAGYKAEMFNMLQHDELANIAYEAIKTLQCFRTYADVIDPYVVDSRIIIGNKLQAGIEERKAVFGTGDYSQTAVFNRAKIRNTTLQGWEVTSYLQGSHVPPLSLEQIVKICEVLRIEPGHIIFPEKTGKETPSIPYHLLPISPERKALYSDFRQLAQEEIYMLAVGLTGISKEPLWHGFKGKKFNILSYNMKQYEGKEEADVQRFNDFMREEDYVRKCLMCREVLKQYQEDARNSAIAQIIDKKKGDNKPEAIYQIPEIRYYDGELIPLNITLIDPNTDNEAAMIEIIFPYTSITYKEMQYGRGEKTLERPRPIFHVDKNSGPSLLEAIKAQIIPLWEKVGEEQNAQREIAKRLTRDKSFTDDAEIAAYTGLTAGEVKNLRT